jgi:hypothetical protein
MLCLNENFKSNHQKSSILKEKNFFFIVIKYFIYIMILVLDQIKLYLKNNLNINKSEIKENLNLKLFGLSVHQHQTER